MGVLMFQGQIGEIPLLSPGKLGNFSHFNPIFHPSLPKLGHSHPVKKLLFRIDMEHGYHLKKLRLDKLKITVSITSNCKKTVFNYAFAKSHEKHLVIECLPWRPNKRYLISFTFYETFNDEPISHKNFTFLRQGSYEIPGVSALPLPPCYPM